MMKQLFTLLILFITVLSCTKTEVKTLMYNVPTDSTNFYLPKKMIRFDTALKYVGYDTFVDYLSYNRFNQLSQFVEYSCHYNDTVKGSVDTFQYYFNYADSLNSMPTSYHFVAKIAGISTANDETHALHFLFGTLLSDSAKSNIPLTRSIDYRHVFYTYAANTITMMAPNTLSQEGDKMYFSNDGTLQKEEYLNGNTIASTTTYYYDAASVANPFYTIKGHWLLGWSNNILSKSRKIPSFYNDSYEPQVASGKNGSNNFIVDGLGRLTYIRDVSTWQRSSVHISY